MTIISDGKPPNFSGILQKEKRRPGETREERNRQRASTRIPSGFSTIPAKNNGCRRARHAQNESRGKPDCRTREPKSKGRAEPGRRPNRGARGRKRPLPKRTDGHPTKSKSGTAQIEASQAGVEKSTGKRADAPKREAEFEQSERRTRTNKRSTRNEAANGTASTPAGKMRAADRTTEGNKGGGKKRCPKRQGQRPAPQAAGGGCGARPSAPHDPSPRHSSRTQRKEKTVPAAI